MRMFLALWLAIAAPVMSWAQFSGGGSFSPCSGDLNASCQVTTQHFTNPLPAANGGTGGTIGVPGAGVVRVLCSIRSANFNITTDQACTIPSSVTAWVPTSIIVTNCSGTFTLAAGGVYPTTSKGGTALVAAAQAYTALSGSSIVLALTMAANIATTRQTANTLYLSLTTGAGSAATCDFYVIGNDLT
jgi:hypothetical protein